MKDAGWILLGGGLILTVGWIALRPRPASAMTEPGRGAGRGSTGVGLNIGGTKGFSLRIPESTANRAFSAVKMAF